MARGPSGQRNRMSSVIKFPYVLIQCPECGNTHAVRRSDNLRATISAGLEKRAVATTTVADLSGELNGDGSWGCDGGNDSS